MPKENNLEKGTNASVKCRKNMFKHYAGIIPKWLFFPSVLALAFLSLPVFALLQRVPWPHAWELIVSPEGREAIWLSVTTCSISTAFCVVCGVPAAFLLAKTRWIGTILRPLVLLPMTLPPVVAGIALLSFLGRRSILGGWLFDQGIWIAFTPAAVILAQIFISLPFLIVAVEGAVRSLDPGLEITAVSLGATPWRVFVKVTLGQVLPAIASGTALCFARALGEFGATLTFAGSVPGSTRTLPLAIYLLRETDTDLSLSLATALLFIALTLIGLSAFFTTASSLRRSTDRSNHCEKDSNRALQIGQSPRDLQNNDSWMSSLKALPLSAQMDAPGRFTGSFSLQRGQTLAIVGPNGAGKSSLLLGLMGVGAFSLMDIHSANTRLGDLKLDENDKHLPPWKRQIALLTQNPRLFPHMTVLDNIIFAMRSCADNEEKHLSCFERRRIQKDKAISALQAVGMESFVHRYPGQLSGGQAARVALIRALLTRPRLLLLDEPFAALDVESAAQMRIFLSRISGLLTIVMVSHSLLDVAALADKVMVVENGQVADYGSVRTMLSKPTNQFVAGFAGANLWWSQTTMTLNPGVHQVQMGGVQVTGHSEEPIINSTVLGAFSHDSVTVSTQKVASSARNVYAASVLTISEAGSYLQLLCQIHPDSDSELPGFDFSGQNAGRTKIPENDAFQICAKVTGAAASQLRLSVGSEVFLYIKASQVRLYGAKDTK